MQDINKIMIIGRLTREPESKNVNGTMAVRLGIACNDDYSKDGQQVKQVDFFDVQVWGKQAENCVKYLHKGSQIAVEGKLKQNRWTDQQGQNHSRIEIKANSVQFLGQPQQGNNNYQQPGNYQQPANNQNNGYNPATDPWADQQGNNYQQPNDPYNDKNIPF